MIKKMYNLTLNELIKEYKKKTILIISILILLSAFFVPFLAKAIVHNANSFNSSMQDSNINYCETVLKHIDSNTTTGKIEKAITLSQLEQAKLNKEYNIQFNSWQTVDSEKYLNTLLSIDIINLRKANIPVADILSNPLLNNLPYSQELATLPKENWDTTILKLNNENKKFLDNIKTNNYLGYLKEEISISKNSITTINDSISKLESKIKVNPNNLELKNQLIKEKTELSITTESLKVLEFRYNNKIPFDNNNWKSETLSSMKETIATLNTPIMTEAQFMAKPIEKIDYQQYKAKKDLIKSNAENQLKKDWYSLNNNIPQQQFATNAQSVVDSFVGVYSIIISLFVIIIAGSIVSSEFSRNTIKLLLVRPVSRFKVLLSKLLAIFLIGYILFFASMIIILITSGFLFGFTNIAAPALKISNGAVYTQAYGLYFVLHILFYSISFLCAGTLAFMLSTLTKSTASSVAVTLILYIGLPIITGIMLIKEHLWFALTPFTYFNIPSAKLIEGIINEPTMSNFAIIHMSTGTIEIIILAIVFAIIAFIKFIKSDIR